MFDNFLLILPTIFLFIFGYFSNYFRQCYYTWKLPGPKGLPLLGNMLDHIGSIEEITDYMLKTSKQFPSLYRVWLGPLPLVNISTADAAQIILTSSHCLEKSPIMVKALYPFSGDTILISKVPKWKYHRSIVIKGFTPTILEYYFGVFVEKSKILSRVLEKELDNKKSFDIFEYVSRASIDTICGSAMGVNVNAQESESDYFNAVRNSFHIMFDRIFHIWKYPDWLFKLTKNYTKLKENQKICLELTSKVINEKRKNNEKMHEESEAIERNPFKKPLLEFLFDMTEKIPEFTDEQLQNEVHLVILAAFETSAMAISYTLLSLAANKDIQNKVYNEILTVFGTSQREIELNDLPKLEYLEMVIKEAMRLYPTIPLVGRVASQDIQVGKYFIPKGMILNVIIISLHRDENIWKDSLKFDPERFTPENIKSRHPYAYIPFSAGPRNCIGPKYAMMFMKTVISTLLRKYEFHTDLKMDKLKFEVELSLKLIGGHQVQMTPRNSVVKT